MRISLSRVLAAVTVAGLLAGGTAACGASEESAGGPCDVRVSTDTKSKPEITVPDCDRPKELQTRDVVEGSGPAAKAGDAVSVHYTGVSWSIKREFDSSWGRGQPYTVQPLGQASVIEGWNQGLVGVKQGGRRLLVIPADLGYGPAGNGEDIPPGETLVFVVDVVSINAAN